MSLANYSDISTALAEWLNREGMSAVTNRVEDFIAIAQRRIHRECDLNAMEEVTTLTIDAQTEAVPADFMRMKSMHITQGTDSYEVLGSPVHEVLNYTYPCRPVTYAVVGTNFYFPAVDQAYTATLIYYKKLPILSTSNTTNWLSDNEPEFLMYAAMVEACSFLKDDSRAQFWEARFQGVKESLMNSEDQMDKESGGLRVRAK